MTQAQAVQQEVQASQPLQQSQPSSPLSIPSKISPINKDEALSQVVDFIDRTHRARRPGSTEAQGEPAQELQKPPEEGQEAQEELSEEDSLAFKDYEDKEEETSDQNEVELDVPENNELNFLEFARQNPNVKIKFPNKEADGGYIEMTAKKAAALLGEASNLDRVARNIKVKEAEIREFEENKRQEFDNLLIGLEVTLVPRLEQAGNAIKEAYKLNEQWRTWAEQHPDPESQARAQAGIEKNQEVIAQSARFIEENRPKAHQFAEIRANQVKQVLDSSRKSFQNPELRNEVIYNETRSELEKIWPASQRSLYPGIRNLDLVSSDETLLGLLRDGLKYRSGPKLQRQAGQSLSGNSSKARSVRAPVSDTAQLQARADKGDKDASAQLIMQFMQKNKQKQG